MRIVFISWSTTGGSGISQRQLATYLASRGHDVRFVVFDRHETTHRASLYAHLSDLSVKASSTALGSSVRAIRDRIGRKGRRADIEGLWHVHSVVPQNALISVIKEFEPDVVIASSVDRWAWRRIRQACASRGVPTILYVREEASLEHLETGALPSLLVANTPTLAAVLRARGYDCAFVPSVTDVSATTVDSSRRVALAINPIQIKGSEMIWEVASRLPAVPFVVQESGKLSGPEREAVEQQVRALSNIELRAATAPGPHLYADARVLLAPYRVNSRPRVILEAQANGIPVLAADLPALVESVGPGGVIAPLDDVDAWVKELSRLWEDEDHYERLCVEARSHARRDDMNPDTVTGQFEALLEGLVPPL